LAKTLVKVQYEELQPILSVKDAIESNSFFENVPKVVSGDISKGFAESDVIVEGTFGMNGQEQVRILFQTKEWLHTCI